MAQRLDQQRLSPNDILPEDLDYWDNLTAPLANSKSLAEFFTNEIQGEFSLRMSRDPRLAIWSASLMFCAPGLVPLALLREYDGSVVLSAIEQLLTMSDHFALLGTLEIASDWVQRDERFAEVGEKYSLRCLARAIGWKLAARSTRQRLRLLVHGSDCITSGRKRPSFWRRLNMAAQASLFVRAAGDCNVDAANLFSWAMDNFGLSYYAATCLDLFDEPKWRPDWIRSNFLMADAAGRTRIAIRSVPEHLRPSSWQIHLTAIEEKLVQDNTYISCRPFPRGVKALA